MKVQPDTVTSKRAALEHYLQSLNRNTIFITNKMDANNGCYLKI